MALLTYVSAGVHDTMIGSATILGTTTNVTTGGVSATGFTAPSLARKATGAWISISSLPSVGNGGDFVVELLESGVVKAAATINFADMKLGFNYARFATPYTFATLTASAYTIRVRNTVASGSLGQLRNTASNIWVQATYDLTVATPTTTDDVWVAGFHDSGLTPKTQTISGTSGSWGTGAATNIGSSQQTMGAALTIGNGGTSVFDQSASTTLQLKGSVFVTQGGLFDMRASSNKARVQKLIFDMVANGDQGFFTATTSNGGQILMTGATYDIYSTYASGLGTAASPMITSIPWDADVGDEIVIGGATDYLKNEVRYIKTRNSSTSFVLSATPGGAESALAQTHAVGAHMANLTRNVIITALNTARGWFANNNSNNALGEFSYVRMEYSDCSSGKSVSLNPTTASTFDGIVMYKSSTGGRGCLLMRQTDATPQTHRGIVLFDTQGTNYSGQSGISFNTTSNKTLTDCFQFNAPSSVVSCALISLSSASTANIFNNCHSYGGNAVNSSAGYVIGIFASSANVFNNCSVNGARQNAVYLASNSGTIFNNCNFGPMGSNVIDITCLTQTLNQALFNTCVFGSATLITNYLNQLETSELTFQNMDSNTSKHRWYTNHGSFLSSGPGLADTTVRTAGSLALAHKPEDNSVGSVWSFKIPAAPGSSVGILGYGYRNASFSAGVAKVELFLPGNVSVTPDASYTFPLTTLQWLPFNISAYYAGTDARYATVKVTAVSNTAGATLFIDDLYDAALNNKVAGLDLWDNGKPSPVMVVTDFSSAVPVLAAAAADKVWQYTDGGTLANTMGKRQVDGADNAELAAVT